MNSLTPELSKINLGWANKEHIPICSHSRYFLYFFLTFVFISFLNLVLWVGGSLTWEGPGHAIAYPNLSRVGVGKVRKNTL